MKRLFALLAFGLSFACQAGEYQSTLLVQTGLLRESDLIVRTISDLESNRICLAFYVRTMGTSPTMTCYDVVSGFRSNIGQVGHFKEGKLVVRKMRDFENNVTCLVAYVSTEGTSPALDCYKNVTSAKFRETAALVRSGHLREGDLDTFRIVDPDSTKTCLVAYVNTGNTSPSLKCYSSLKGGKGGSMSQTSYLREGDLIARKIVDQGNAKECLITYVSTEGTSPHIYCAELRTAQKAQPQWPQQQAPAAKPDESAPATRPAPIFRPES
ncbi:MAG: hypothetical protein PVI91_03965 [Gammaproteobacteria bacterium]|jgi:hypothetical protein